MLKKGNLWLGYEASGDQDSRIFSPSVAKFSYWSCNAKCHGYTSFTYITM